MDGRANIPENAALTELRLLQLCDTALPIGSLAHSYGLETLVDRGLLAVPDLPEVFATYLEETGTLEAVFCREAFRLGQAPRREFAADEWVALNRRLSAMKPGREAREASITLGQNFLRCVLVMEDLSVVRRAFEASRFLAEPAEIHHGTAFGLVCGALGVEEDRSIAAYLHQQIAGLISACQRLLPLGQSAAARILWDLKPSILRAVQRSAHCDAESVYCFNPFVDWAAMEHPALTTRLFVS